jgi:hypothetical protein
MIIGRWTIDAGTFSYAPLPDELARSDNPLDSYYFYDLHRAFYKNVEKTKHTGVAQQYFDCASI